MLRHVDSGSIHPQVLDDVVSDGDGEESGGELEEEGTQGHGDVEEGPGGDELVGVGVAGFFLCPSRDGETEEEREKKREGEVKRC